MRALTILQPFAELIVSTPEELAALADTEFGGALEECDVSVTPKRIENRPRPLGYEGELLIHAGASDRLVREFIRDEDDTRTMAFGAIVGVAKLAGCFRVVKSRYSGAIIDPPAWASRKWPWLRQHPHVEGPCCLVLENVRVFDEPIAWRGKQGLWNPETWDSTPQRLAELRQALEAAEPIEWTP